MWRGLNSSDPLYRQFTDHKGIDLLYAYILADTGQTGRVAPAYGFRVQLALWVSIGKPMGLGS